MNAYLKTGSYATLFQGLEGRMADVGVQSSFRNAIRNNFDDRAGALAALQSSRVKGKEALLGAAMTDWVGEDMTAALSFLQSVNDEQLTSQVVTKSYQKIASYDRESARNWIELIQNPAIRERARKELGF